MQVFLPVPDFKQSLAILDDSRLRKQRVEAFQLLNVLLNRTDTKGWRNHPAAVMFRKYVPALQLYYNLSLDENARRGFSNIKLQHEVFDEQSIVMPHWLGDDAVHRTHRSRLLMKGKIDVLADRIRVFIKQNPSRTSNQKSSANHFLKVRGFLPLNEMRQNDYEEVSKLLDSLGAPQSIQSNYYSKFGWTEIDTLEYVWPGETADQPNRILR